MMHTLRRFFQRRAVDLERERRARDQEHAIVAALALAQKNRERLRGLLQEEQDVCEQTRAVFEARLFARTGGQS